MRTFFLSLTFLLASFSFGYSQYHSAVLPDLSDQELLDALVNNYKTSTTLSYGDARDAMYTDIDNLENNVLCIYTRHGIFLSPSEPSPREFLYMNGIDDGINCEHSYPRSKGADFGNPKSDIHHLYPSRVIVNTKRSTKPFAEIDDTETDEWFYLNQSQTNIPGTNIDDYSESDTDAFEPRESAKGNIARSIMYFYTMYKSEADAQDPQYFWDQIETLCDWHYADPVDQEEYARTFKIASYQDGKTNPFVLDCSVAGRTYCDMISDLCSQTVPNKELVDNEEITLFPNPSKGIVYFAFANVQASITIDIYNMYGQRVQRETFGNTQNVSMDHGLDAGFYTCKIHTEGGTIDKQFVVTK